MRITTYGKILYSIARLVMNLIYDTMEISSKITLWNTLIKKSGPSSKHISFLFTNRSLLKLKLLFLQCDLYNVIYLNIIRKIRITFRPTSYLYEMLLSFILFISSNVAIHKIRGNQRQTDHHTHRHRQTEREHLETWWEAQRVML